MASIGRPRKFDRSAAVGIAMNEFWEHGYTDTSVLSISQKLGITRSSFYHSFESLDALFEEALKTYVSLIQQGDLSPIYFNSPKSDASETTHETNLTIRLFFKALCRFRASDPKHRGCLIVNSVAEMGNMPVGTRNSVEAVVHSAVDSMTRVVSKGIESGGLVTHKPAEETAQALFALVCGLNTLSRVYHDEQTLWRIADAGLAALDIPE